MRKLVFLALVYVSALSISCSKDEVDDFTTSEDLIGTAWKCTSGDNWLSRVENVCLKFTSTTDIENWVKNKNKQSEKLVATGVFSIYKDMISITLFVLPWEGIIDGNSIKMTVNG